MNDKESPKRSPNFPAIGLEEAIEKAKLIYAKDQLATSTATVIVEHMGYNRLHGSSRRTLSALKQFGLLDEVGDQRAGAAGSGIDLDRAGVGQRALRQQQ